MKLGINILNKTEFVSQKRQADTRLRLLHYALARAASLLLMICVGSAAVQVHAQDSLTTEPSTKECPDLSGTYESRSTAWIDKFHLQATGTVRPKTQTRQFATFQRHGGGYTLIWHMPRQDVLAEARLQAERDPHKYGIWLDKVLRDPKLPLPLGMSEQEWFNRLAIYGPVFRVDVVLPLRQCKEGWFLVGSMGSNGPAEVEGGMDGTRDVELWLGRDKDGSLSLKLHERRKLVLLGGRYFNEVAIRLWSSEHLDKWPVAPEPDLTPIREEDLPEGNRPSKRIPKCQITGDHEAVFFQRLKANLAKCGDSKLLIQYLLWPHAPGRGLRPNSLHGDCLGAGCRQRREGGGLPADRPLHPANRFAGFTSSVEWKADGKVQHDGCAVSKRIMCVLPRIFAMPKPPCRRLHW